MSAKADRMLKPSEVADRLRVTPERVFDAIESGELRAADLARPGSGRRSYRIHPADVEQWLSRMAVQPTRRLRARDLDPAPGQRRLLNFENPRPLTGTSP